MLQTVERLSGREPRPLPFITKRSDYIWIVVATACIGAFMGQLDASITQLVLPVLERDFEASVDSVSWVAVIYLLVVAIMLPIFGRLSDMIGRKLIYIGGFLTFVVGSCLCGLAPNLEMLIASRALQAVGSAALGANSVAIIVSAAGAHERGRALGIQAAVQAIGLCTGPALGGLIIAELDWRWVFWLNLPVGIAGAIFAWLVLPTTDLPVDRGRFDFWGAIFLAPGLAALLLATNEAGAWGLSSWWIWMTAVAAIVFLIAFVWREQNTHSPLISLALFRSAAFTLGNVAGLLANTILFGLFFLLPFVFERAFHDTALLAGLRLAIIPFLLAVTAPLSGVLSEKYGERVLCTAGMLGTAAGLGILYLALRPETPDLYVIVVSLAVIGIGQGAFGAPNNSAIMATAPSSEIGEVAGAMNVVRTIGTSMGIAMSAALLSWQLGGSSGHSLTLLATPEQMLAAARIIIVVFATLAVLAAVASGIRSDRTQRSS
ncbi:MFS transporter [Tardiphaga sp. 862_B3_N4_1]|uniref:MFS transporter n=1 Tax=Tardiphaga sp. 862_B3_N4_1 TaxID=3240764 RepID=UPI003F21A106